MGGPDPQRESTSLAGRCVCQLDVAAEPGNRAFHDRKSEASAHGGGRSSAIKPLKHLVALDRADTGTVILHSNSEITGARLYSTNTSVAYV